MYFKSSYGEIYYEIHGPENSPVVAFVHGLFAEHKMFEKQVSKFKDQYRVLLWDMPEHGQSVKLDQPFNLSIAAKCFIELLDELGIETVLLAGVSMGGYVSQYLAGEYPERVAGIAIDGAHPLHIKLTRLEYFGFMIGSAIFKLLPFSVFKYLCLKIATGDDTDVKRYAENTFSQLERRRALHIYEGLRRQILKGIEKPAQPPVLITHGEKEAPFIRKMCAQWHNSNPEIEYVIIPGAHDAMFTKPDEYNKALESFLQGSFAHP